MALTPAQRAFSYRVVFLSYGLVAVLEIVAMVAWWWIN